jgi:XTP/dITP diphosphohydrolase
MSERAGTRADASSAQAQGDSGRADASALAGAALARVVLASNNAGKLREFDAMLGAAGIALVAQGELGVPEAEEPHVTFIENALAKARHAARLTGLPALADDSGLCVRALGGEPGVYSARYAQRAGGEKSDAANNAHLVERLRGQRDRRGYYFCVLVLVRHADDPEPLIAEGRWHGEILEAPRGTHGFGYDPYFFVPDLNATAAELEPAVKNARSHRAIALAALLARLREER